MLYSAIPHGIFWYCTVLRDVEQYHTMLCNICVHCFVVLCSGMCCVVSVLGVAVLCCAVLNGAVRCCAVLCLVLCLSLVVLYVARCAVLCDAGMCYAVLCRFVRCFVVLCLALCLSWAL